MAFQFLDVSDVTEVDDFNLEFANRAKLRNGITMVIRRCAHSEATATLSPFGSIATLRTGTATVRVTKPSITSP